MTNQDAVYLFLTDLKHQRDAKKRLFELAEKRPEAVLLYFESLPVGWEKSDDAALLLKIRKFAQAALQTRSPSSNS